MSTGVRALAGSIRLVADAGPFRGQGVTVILTSAPQFSGGVGGWEVMSRPGRRPARWWRGGTEMALTIDGVLDVDRGDPTFGVEDRLTRLRQFGVRPGGQEAPAPLRLAGDLSDPYSARGGLWVLVGMGLGDRLYLRDGRLRRQAVTLELADYAPVETIQPVSVRRTRASVNRPRVRQVTTRQGDTLRGMAVRELGFGGGWSQIRDWNPRLFKGSRHTGPDDPLRAGLRVTIR